jgi:HD-like signal output (HDOD) protein
MTEELQRTLDQVISRIGDLPALPRIVSDVLNITENPAVAMSQISDRIQRDPALTAKILKVSNSSYYGMKQYVGTLKLALVILGVREIRNIVLGISIFESLSNEKVDALVARIFWDHSVRVGGFSKKLGGALALGLQGEDFISGLLHDMGKLLLLRQSESLYTRIFKASGGYSEPLCSLEMNTFGFDHADAGAALAACWNLPQALADAIWCHHGSADRVIHNAKDPKLAALVRIANRAAREDFTEVHAPPGLSCTDEEAWTELHTAWAPSEPSARRELLAAFVGEFDERAQHHP